MANRTIPVVFVTTVFDGTETGPGTYARYIWRGFRDDPEFDFHLVTPAASEVHPNLHVAGEGGGSLALYRRLQELAMQVAHRLGAVTIVHGNSTHSMGRFIGYQGTLILQVNDYDVATLPARAIETLRTRGPRRLAALAWRYRQERRLLPRASLLLCNSSFTAGAIRSAYGISNERIRVIHKAVDTTAYGRPDPLPADPQPKRQRGSRLIFVGADWHRKGLDTLLEAMLLVIPHAPGLSLTAIGPDRGNVQLGALIERLGLQERVDLMGRLPSDMVVRHLWHSDVFVLPSRREALGVAVLEAMAAGVPVVAARVGGIPEIIASEGEGLLVPPDDPTALAAVLSRLLAEDSLRRSIGAAGCRRSEDFSADAMIRAIKAIYLAPRLRDKSP